MEPDSTTIKSKVDLSVIAPCFNESQNVIELTERLQNTFRKGAVNGEVILINDHSSDNTGLLVDELAAKYPNVIACHHESNRGLAAGWKTGLQSARGNYICFIDADLQNLPEDVLRLYREIIFSHVDLVQGLRSPIGRLRDHRYFLSRGLNIMLNFIFRMKSRDNKSGFILGRREVIEDILKHRFHYIHPQTFVTVAAKAKNYSVREVETIFQDRQIGKSYIGPTAFNKVTFQTLADIAKAIFEYRFVDNYDASMRVLLDKFPPQHSDLPWPLWRKLFWRLYVLLFPLHHWTISYNAAGYLKDIRQTQWLMPDQLQEYQLEKLRKLISHVYYHVPFYRDTLDQLGLKPEDIRTLEDLRKLPIISKKTVTDNLYFGIISNIVNRKRMLRITTSGSTGEPFVVYASKYQLEMRWAATRRSLEWLGYRFGDKQLRLWHKYLGMKTLQSIKEILEAFFSRRKFVPAYELSDVNFDRFMRQMVNYRPVILDGYAESYNLIAKYLKNKEHTYQVPQTKGIMSSGQTLPPESRKIIEDRFGCRVFDKYGAREFAGGIAYECEYHNGYHTVSECNIIEIIKDGRPARPGEIGEVVVTELNNYDLPLIRYKLGDLAMQVDNSQACPCGRGLPRVGAIQGRAQATIVGTNKQYIPGTFFARLFADYSHAIKQFQVVQDKFGEIELKIVKNNLYSDEILNEILTIKRKFLGEDMKINVSFTEEISLSRTGKRHHSISHLDLDFNNAKFLRAEDLDE